MMVCLGRLVGICFFTEILNFLDLWECVCRNKISLSFADSWRWSGSPDGLFSTKDMYVRLTKEFSEDVDESFPLKILWWKVLPSKISAFSWRAIRGRIPPKDNLLKCGISDGIGMGNCSLCLSSLETTNHLLVFCPVILLVWDAILNWLGKVLLYSSSMKEHFLEFVESEHVGTKRKVMSLVW